MRLFQNIRYVFFIASSLLLQCLITEIVMLHGSNPPTECTNASVYVLIMQILQCLFYPMCPSSATIVKLLVYYHVIHISSFESECIFETDPENFAWG